MFAAILLVALFTLNCFSSEKSLPETTGTGQVSGKVVGPDGTGLPGVLVTTFVKGKTLQVTTALNGTFSFSVADTERGQGFNLQFTKANFENANQAAVISLPNLKVDIGNVTMFISGGSEVTTRKILGQVMDNFSYRPLVGANVTTIDSAGQAVVTTTDEAGKFTLKSSYFALQSTFAVSVFKGDFISRTDLVAQITAEDNTIRNNPVRLYHKFGSLYAYVSEDTISPLTPLNGVSVSLTNSNNQVLTCITGIGASPGGPYDSGSQLPIGAYCPDLTGLTSPLTGILSDNNGGIRMQNDFILLGNRYDITFTKAGAGCSTRQDNAHSCYKSKTTYSDVSLISDNSISGGSISLLWDSWIYGKAIVQDPFPISGTCPAGGTCPGAGCTCPANNTTVTLYDGSGTYITQTVTDSGGNFRFDDPRIFRNQSYSVTFDRPGAYSRRLGYLDRTNPPEALPAPLTTLYQAPITVPIPATANTVGPMYGAGANQVPGGTCAGGAICLTALPPPTHCLMGTVKDYWSDAAIDGATVAVFDGGWRTDTTGPRASSGGFPALGNGQFIIQGNFAWPAARTGTRSASSTTVSALASSTADLAVGMMVSGTGIPSGTTISAILSANSIQLSSAASANAADALTFMPLLPIEISKPAGYTGEVLVNKQTFTFAHNAVAACPAAPYNLDTQPACSATDVGPSGGTNCVPKLKLYPIGMYASINGSSKYFRNQIKQTYERFLTEKIGLTISARAGDLKWTSTTPQKNYDYDALYLHLDDTPKILPNVPEGKWSNHVPVNPLPTVCSPTVSSPCSPQANGVLAESIGTDSRIQAWDIKTYVYYHFYAAAPGFYTIQTTGSTDTVITLISQSGANLGTDDDGGTGSNAKIGPVNLLRGWYYVRVKGKNDNVFGFFDVSVTGPAQSEANYVPMMSASYGTNCSSGNGNMVLSWYDATGHTMYMAAPGENGGCSASATIEKHGSIGEIVRGRFGGTLRPVAPSGSSAIVTDSGTLKGFYNIIRSE